MSLYGQNRLIIQALEAQCIALPNILVMTPSLSLLSNILLSSSGASPDQDLKWRSHTKRMNVFSFLVFFYAFFESYLPEL